MQQTVAFPTARSYGIPALYALTGYIYTPTKTDHNVINVATQDDMPEMVSLYAAHMRADYAASAEKDLNKTFKDPKGSILISRAGDEMVGLLGYILNENKADMTHLYVKRKHEGVGTHLVDVFIRFANIIGIEKVSATSSFESVGFYDYMDFDRRAGLKVSKSVARHVLHHRKYG